MIIPSDNERRRRLRVAAKLMALIAVLAIAWVLFGSISSPQREARPALTIDLTNLPPGQLQRVQWRNVSLLVLHRDASMLAALEQANPALQDPNSRHASQPEGMDTPFRSAHPAWFVAVGHGTDWGCELDYVGADANVPVSPWHGGFRDRCGGSYYDLAGRVYSGQSAPRNLPVPPHHFAEPARLVVGE